MELTFKSGSSWRRTVATRGCHKIYPFVPWPQRQVSQVRPTKQRCPVFVSGSKSQRGTHFRTLAASTGLAVGFGPRVTLEVPSNPFHPYVTVPPFLLSKNSTWLCGHI
jgi:hypothetical protein